MLNPFFLILILAAASAIGYLAYMLYNKKSKVEQLELSVNNLKRTLDEMDEQAKLVIRTDIELNKTQEELDKKVSGLYVLQKLSRTISSSMEENQIFQKIEPNLMQELGFEKTTAFMWNNEQQNFVNYLNIGYSAEEIDEVKIFVFTNKELYLDIIKADNTVSTLSLNDNPTVKDKINKAFKVHAFVCSPIMPKEGNKGFFFAGTEHLDTIITEGDEELITILVNQLAQSIENARLFEKTWTAHQTLEKNVEERTKELSIALEEVQKISHRKNDFVSNVSHELRTPLTSIKGYAAILLAGKLGDIPEQAFKRLEKINKHADELGQFVNDLLDISRIESGKVTLKLLPMNLKNILDEISDMLTVQMKEKSISFLYNIPADTPEVMADYNQIKRVFINIVNNAIKYTPQGRITINIKKQFDGFIQIDINDTGYGMPEEALSKLFTEFYRVDTPLNQEIKGTGLGLAMVKHIIEAHKGKIWVTSKVGVGSTFSFTLPQA